MAKTAIGKRSGVETPLGKKQVPQHLEQLSWVMDQSLRIPGTRIRFGLDSIIGLLPGIGDVIGMLVSTWVVAGSVQAGARRRTVFRMLFNVGRDALIGAIPFIGDLYDIGSKANSKNMELLRRDLEAQVSPAIQRRERLMLWGVIALAAIGLIFAVIGFIAAIRWLFVG